MGIESDAVTNAMVVALGDGWDNCTHDPDGCAAGDCCDRNAIVALYQVIETDVRNQIAWDIEQDFTDCDSCPDHHAGTYRRIIEIIRGG